MSDFPVDKNSYLAFDGLTIKEKIKERLNQTGVYTDQNYEGSNLAAFNDSVAMSFSLLLYYLNQQSIQSQFTNNNVFEAINKTVKFLDYKPIGHQTANLNFTLSCSDLDAGFYTIPRYSYIDVGGIPYSINKDLSFTKTQDSVNEKIEGVDEDSILYQGYFAEYPTYIPSGTPREIVYLSVDDNDVIDHFNVHVYVKTDGVWKQWERTSSLYINDFDDEVFEIRYNENKIYELTFGDDVNGKQLQPTDEVLIYYLVSRGSAGEVAANSTANRSLILFNSSNLSNILSSESVSTLSNTQAAFLSFDNRFSSSYYSEPESVDSIKKNAIGNYSSQFAITTRKAYETFMNSNFSNILHSVKVSNNREYLDSYIKYYYELGLTKPQFESRALFNQINYADSCNFNNVYIFAVPKTVTSRQSYLLPTQKQLIIDTIRDEQVLTSETIIADPVYVNFDVCYPADTTNIELSDIDNTVLVITKEQFSKRNNDSIKKDVESIFLTYFDPKNCQLGKTINKQDIINSILSIDGVRTVQTKNVSTNETIDGTNFIYWNPIYFDASVTELKNTQIVLEDFQFPILNTSSFVDKIQVV